MRRAIAISEAALAGLLKEVQPGMSEQEIAARLEALMVAGGADGLAFGTLVQTGPNSDNPLAKLLSLGEFSRTVCGNGALKLLQKRPFQLRHVITRLGKCGSATEPSARRRSALPAATPAILVAFRRPLTRR